MEITDKIKEACAEIDKCNATLKEKRTELESLLLEYARKVYVDKAANDNGTVYFITDIDSVKYDAAYDVFCMTAVTDKYEMNAAGTGHVRAGYSWPKKLYIEQDGTWIATYNGKLQIPQK